MGAFVEIKSVKIGKNKRVAISRMGDGRYSMAQKMQVLGDDDKPMNIYLRGAFVLEGKALIAIRDLISELFNDDGTEKQTK